MPGTNQTYEITTNVVERLTGSSAPWYEPGKTREDTKIFGLCPHCENPVQLRALYKTGTTPHGSHVGRAVRGLANFDVAAQRRCPYKTENRRGRGYQLPPSDFDEKILNVVRQEFDRIVMILRDFLGISIYPKHAEEMLMRWHDSEGYRFSRVSLANVPWMIPYGQLAIDLYGREILSEEARIAIAKAYPGARFNEKGKLTRTKGTKSINLTLQCLEHRFHNKGDVVAESLCVRIVDWNNPLSDGSARTIWEKREEFDLGRFASLVAARNPWRNEQMLRVATDILGEPNG